MNLDNVKIVRDYIRDNPRTYVQADWTRHGPIKKHCIGAYVVLLSGVGYCLDDSPLMLGFINPNFKTKKGITRKEPICAKQTAEKLLFPDLQANVASRYGDILFSGSPKEDWPKPFSDLWLESFLKGNNYEETLLLQASIAVDFLTLIIEQGKSAIIPEKNKKEKKHA